ncbi:hypothetical protein CJ030_MR2G004016 [Morella rubra]|uniref:Uncharacterized protein n=1 Tax=Morella rubra TaxID=262757 RepID=A0A6A1W991_9ROSI|nr:hypothetical protein CJ030_MR2G004016 [Morella rubra]
MPPLISRLEPKADVAYKQEDVSKKCHESALAVQMAIQAAGLIDEEWDGTEPNLGSQKVMMLHGDPAPSKITMCNANTQVALCPVVSTNMLSEQTAGHKTLQRSSETIDKEDSDESSPFLGRLGSTIVLEAQSASQLYKCETNVEV